mmetsp:Transcript_15312/g.43141  ORF Transcript_15312/g.43141 Transcript_15312/m.43141 type:complete len:345 (-) Transcript_15312:89-1123(-)
MAVIVAARGAVVRSVGSGRVRRVRVVRGVLLGIERIRNDRGPGAPRRRRRPLGVGGVGRVRGILRACARPRAAASPRRGGVAVVVARRHVVAPQPGRGRRRGPRGGGDVRAAHGRCWGVLVVVRRRPGGAAAGCGRLVVGGDDVDAVSVRRVAGLVRLRVVHVGAGVVALLVLLAVLLVRVRLRVLLVVVAVVEGPGRGRGVRSRVRVVSGRVAAVVMRPHRGGPHGPRRPEHVLVLLQLRCPLVCRRGRGPQHHLHAFVLAAVVAVAVVHAGGRQDAPVLQQHVLPACGRHRRGSHRQQSINQSINRSLCVCVCACLPSLSFLWPPWFVAAAVALGAMRCNAV